MTRWLVTRPLEEAERFAEAMRDRGLDPVIAPVLEIEPIDPGPIALDDVQAVLATSRNGIDAFARRVARRDLPVLAVGDATAELARTLGFQEVASAAGDGADLAELARARLDPAAGVLLHPSGEDVARDLSALLSPAGFTVRRIVLYRARPATELPPAAVEALADPRLAGVVFFSPRTAKVFATLAARVDLTHRLAGLTAVCLSPAVAQALDPSPWRAVRIADRPDSPSLLARLSEFPAEQETRTANGMDPTPDKPGEAAPSGPESQQPDDASATPRAQPGSSEEKAGESAAPVAEDSLGLPGEGGEALTPTERVIEAFGGIRPMAAKLTVPVTTVQGWKRRNAIPEQRHADILAAAKTHGITLDPAELARTRPATPEEGAVESAELSEPETPPGPPRVGPPPLPPPPPAEPPGNVARSAWTAAGVAIVFAAVSATAPIWSPKLFGPTAPPPAPQGSPTLSDRVAFIEKRLADFPSGISEAIDGLGKRVEALEKPPGGPLDPAAIEKGRADLAARVDALQQKLDQLAGGAPQGQPEAQPQQPQPQPAPAPAAPAPEAVAALEARVAALESAQAAVKTLSDTVATLSSGAQASGSTLAALQQQVDTVKATVERLRNSDTGAQALSLAAGQLRSALDTGAPLDETLALLRGLAQADPALAGAVTALEPAAKGVPSRAALSTGFAQAAEAARKADQPQSGDWVDRSLAVVQDLVTVRPAPGEVEGNDTNAVLARAEGRLQRGDLAGAVDAVKALTGPAASSMAAWRGQAEARLAAESALQSLSALAVQRLAAASDAAAGDVEAKPADTQPPKAP
ncbi:uroporphyrinogen-III synthase [Inquilinus limosus]|uniref:uroporphyrinogen-III synthase n=1 Tax=Inquilinus limosus TaxID=171674 RepID=UPI003F18B6C0